MTTSYADKGTRTKKRSKSSVEQTGTATDTDKTKAASLVDQDPPIIIKPGGSVNIDFLDGPPQSAKPGRRKFRLGAGGTRVYLVRIRNLDSGGQPNDYGITFPNYQIELFFT